MLDIPVLAASFVLPEIYSAAEFLEHTDISKISDAPRTVRIPPSEILPSRMKRRMSRLTQMVIHTTEAARSSLHTEPPECPLIFGTANGEIETMGIILTSLFSDPPLISPTRFHNSVHNTATGYWSILLKRHTGTSTITAGDLTGEHAILDAAIRMSPNNPLIQVCVADEAITVPKWADPDHCTIDFCGSLILGTNASEAPLGTIRHLKILPMEDHPVHQAKRIADEWNPDHVYTNLPGMAGKMLAFPGIRHPDEIMLAMIMRLLDPACGGRLLFIRKSRRNMLSFILLEKSK